MSKTKGNSVDPLGTIDEIGADALRFALINGTAPGTDQRFGAGQGRGRPELRQQAVERDADSCSGAGPRRSPTDASGACPDAAHLGPAEHWILSRAAATARPWTGAMPTFQFGEATRLLHDAIWSEYCDWDLELAKVRLAAADCPAEPRGHVVGARLGARQLPAPAAPGDAVRHRAICGRRCRAGPTTRIC